MHKAFISKIEEVVPIEGANTVQTAIVLGTQVVVSKDTKVGDIGVFFPTELQLSDDYCKENNLYREQSLNKNKDAKGFFDENRRVRAQKFLKVKSDGYFAPVSSLSYTGYNINELKVGNEFDTLNNHVICCKYFSPKTLKALEQKSKTIKKLKVTEAPTFVTHSDTEQFSFYSRSIPKGSIITIDHKWHGTSFRVGNVKTVRLKKGINKVLNFGFGVIDKIKPKKFREEIKFRILKKIQEIQSEKDSSVWSWFFNEKYEYVAGSRRVNLFEDRDMNKEGFHGPESYRFEILEKLKPFLSKNMIMFGEIVGYVNGSPIMAKQSTSILKDKKVEQKYGKEIVYSYGCLPTEYKIKIYRIGFVNDDGEIIDMTVPQMMNYLDKFELPYSKPLVEPFIYDGDETKLVKLVTDLAEREDKLGEDYVDPSHLNEGVVVRVDDKTLVPKFYKYKNFFFKVLEGIAKEQEVDMEDVS